MQTEMQKIESQIVELAKVDAQIERINAQIAKYAATYAEKLAGLNKERAEIENGILPLIKEELFPGKAKSSKLHGYKIAVRNGRDKWVIADSEAALKVLKNHNCDGYIRTIEEVNVAQIQQAPLPEDVANGAGIMLEKGVNIPSVKKI